MPAASGTPQLTVRARAHQGTATVVISGELDIFTAPALEGLLRGVLARRPRRLVLDLAGVRFMDCCSARVLAAASRALPGTGRAVIRRVSWPAARLLRLAGLWPDFTFEGSSRRRRPPLPRCRHENRAVRIASQAVR